MDSTWPHSIARSNILTRGFTGNGMGTGRNWQCSGRINSPTLSSSAKSLTQPEAARYILRSSGEEPGAYRDPLTRKLLINLRRELVSHRNFQMRRDSAQSALRVTKLGRIKR